MSKRYLISEEELLNLLSDSIELRALAPEVYVLFKKGHSNENN